MLEVFWYPYATAIALRDARIPLLIAPERLSGEQLVGLLAAPLVVALDNCPTNDTTLTVAAEWVRLFGVDAALVDVPPPHGLGLPSEAPAQDARMLLERAQERLAQLTKGTPCAISTRLLSGYPAARLLQYLREHPASAVLPGAHHQCGGQRFFIGDVATSLVRQAPNTVLPLPGNLAMGQAMGRVMRSSDTGNPTPPTSA